ncbi:SURF1 family protein [Halioxenophilus aromaticivorans]|uniref:SURF1-like protein n=1 Tax=Halioxenophilus aromaticivorans TaxID=1306992 RepID=A0AAV3U8H1_9ALTE
MQLTAAIKKLQWHPNKPLLCFFLFFFCLLTILGCWQLSRAEQKHQWLIQRDQSPTPLANFINDLSYFSGEEFTAISLRGRIDKDKAWLLQNQRVNHQLGYDLLVPFLPELGPSILINLGWQATTDLPGWLNNSGQTIVIQGKVRKPMDLPFVSNVFKPGGDSVVEITPDGFPYNNLEKRWYLQISSEHPLAQITHWQGKTISPAKHTAYAVQWFSMAAVLSLAFLLASTNVLQIWRQHQNPT